LSCLLVMGFARGARAGDDPSTWPSTWIRVCVLPAPGINVWSYSGGTTVRMDKEEFRKKSRALLVFAFDPFAPPENRERLPAPDKFLPCQPKPPPKQTTEEKKKDEPPKPAEKNEAPRPDDKTPAAAAPAKKEEAAVQLPPKIVYPKTEEEEEPRPRPPANGVTARWPEAVLPMKTETVLPNRPLLPVVRKEDTERLPMTHILPMKNETGGDGDGDGTGHGPKKTIGEKIARELAFGGAIATGQLNEDTKHPDGKQYGIPGGKNADGPNHPAAQAAAGATLIAISLSGGAFEKKLKDALAKKGTKVVIEETGKVGEKAAEKLVQEYVGKEGAKKAGERLAHLADAMNKSGAIGEYAVMKKFTDGMGGRVQAHHILEESMIKKWKLGNPDRGMSVILTDAEHKAITAKLKAAKTIEAKTTQKLWQAYQEAYVDHPDWLAAIKSYFAKGK
jgi:hypothetical protein